MKPTLIGSNKLGALPACSIKGAVCYEPAQRAGFDMLQRAAEGRAP